MWLWGLSGDKLDPKWEELPLFPDRNGQHLSKSMVIKMIRQVISLTGTALTRPGPEGEAWDRFGEHVLRVSGAQMMGTPSEE